MANNLFISYDLHNADADRYDMMHAAISQLGTSVYLQFSMFYVKSPYTITQCRDHLAKQMTARDKLLVIDASTAIPRGIEPNQWQRVLDLWNA